MTIRRSFLHFVLVVAMVLFCFGVWLGVVAIIKAVWR